MSVIVEMRRNAGEPKRRTRFFCPLPVYELAHAFGWHPQADIGLRAG
jgi:hypothetical protein